MHRLGKIRTCARRDPINPLCKSISEKYGDGQKTYTLPTRKTVMSPNLRERDACRFATVGSGKIIIARSVTMFGADVVL